MYNVTPPATISQKTYLDVMHMPHQNGYQYLIAAKDDLTGVSEARAMKNITSKTVAKFLLEKVLLQYGMVGQIVTDNGTETKGAYERLVKKMNIPHIRITPYNKHANGVVGRGHYILHASLIKACPKNENGTAIGWYKHVDTAIFADRVTVNSVTGYSPYI